MGKQKLSNHLQKKLAANEKLFIPYIMAGDGGLENLEERIQFLDDAGVAAIELGIPFSDPVADGPVIQEAGIRARKSGTTLKKILDVLERKKDSRTVPIVLMTYINPIYKFGIANFFEACKQAGVDGVIIPDVPMEEEQDIAVETTKQDIAFIRLAALTSPEDRLKQIAERSEGFLYAVSVTGTTGERATYVDHIDTYLQSLKTFANVPVLAGFGVSNSEQAKTLGASCDGVIVGSSIVRLFHEQKTDDIKAFIQESIRPS
ncbi:MAG TPA: tryptophan synthase subunit alpha [Candidatus Avamphibacillus intestinigallinarum]|nr:tryptophan synthase subunit alpha [Candidatus Avamphibacillus intestinigallinarum]